MARPLWLSESDHKLLSFPGICLVSSQKENVLFSTILPSLKLGGITLPVLFLASELPDCVLPRLTIIDTQTAQKILGSFCAYRFRWGGLHY